MDHGGKQYIFGQDLNTPLDSQNERMAFDFLIEHIERHRGNLKTRGFYSNQVRTEESPQITSKVELDEHNLATLHLDEMDVLDKNLEYLTRTRAENLKRFL